ncbi:hypothetical protein R3P38DRAFT_2771209 [Favolaschia claudopus]|uniref:Uncharacterized protein n=1 Tax=Favolaschia claudopus TaxID=2862362 RepID=A0AAW0C9D5_9AGAR
MYETKKRYRLLLQASVVSTGVKAWRAKVGNTVKILCSRMCGPWQVDTKETLAPLFLHAAEKGKSRPIHAKRNWQWHRGAFAFNFIGLLEAAPGFKHSEDPDSARVYKVVVGGLITFKNAHARHAIMVGGVAEEGIIDCLRAVMLGLGTVGVGDGQSHAKFHENNTDQNWDHERKGTDASGGAIGGPHHVAAFINVFTGHGMTQNKCLSRGWTEFDQTDETKRQLWDWYVPDVSYFDMFRVVEVTVNILRGNRNFMAA